MAYLWDRSNGPADSGVPPDAGPQGGDNARRAMVVVLIEPRVLIRECLARCLGDMSPGASVVSFSTMEGWRAVAGSHPDADVVLLCVSKQSQTRTEIEQNLQSLAHLPAPPPVVVLGDGDDPTQILDALDGGARGFIPTSVPLAVAVEAIRLVRAGGTFVPASSLMAARHAVKQSASNVEARPTGMFTEKQAAVVQALRLGKPNKIIAYELGMCESTVKVHVRHIMKKLKARNRTQVAYMYESLSVEHKQSGHATVRVPVRDTPLAALVHA